MKKGREEQDQKADKDSRRPAGRTRRKTNTSQRLELQSANSDSSSESDASVMNRSSSDEHLKSEAILPVLSANT